MYSLKEKCNKASADKEDSRVFKGIPMKNISAIIPTKSWVYLDAFIEKEDEKLRKKKDKYKPGTLSLFVHQVNGTLPTVEASSKEIIEIRKYCIEHEDKKHKRSVLVYPDNVTGMKPVSKGKGNAFFYKLNVKGAFGGVEVESSQVDIIANKYSLVKDENKNGSPTSYHKANDRLFKQKPCPDTKRAIFVRKRMSNQRLDTIDLSV